MPQLTKAKKKTVAPVSKPTRAAPRKTKTVAAPDAAGDQRQLNRAAAKKMGLSLAQYTILKLLADGTPRGYKDIQEATGYYSNLTAQLRPSHEGSLVSKGLVKEHKQETDGKQRLTFTATAKGIKLASKKAV